MMNELILCDITPPIATITLNRPTKLNALTPRMLDQLAEAFDTVEQSHDVRVVLLMAAGQKAFSVGADINQWSALQPLDMWREWILRGQRVFERIEQCRQPVIAVLDGYTLGGGLELAMAADLRIASESARFALPEVKIATTPGWAGSKRLVQLVGVSRAKLMMFTGRQIDAQTASEWGLVNDVVSAETTHSHALNLANEISANAPISVQMVKQLVGSNHTLALESMAGALAASTADGREGIAAFREKRSPKFEGK